MSILRQRDVGSFAGFIETRSSLQNSDAIGDSDHRVVASRMIRLY
jgi:hypothetical protein